jgi:hypothetical protein
MRFLSSGFFHESVVPGPLIHTLKDFSHLLRFRGGIHQTSLKKGKYPRCDTRRWRNIRVAIRGYFKISAFHTRRWRNIRVAIRGYFHGLCRGGLKYPRIATRIFQNIRVAIRGD